MRPTLKENPKEWTKFGLALACFLDASVLLLWRRRILTISVLQITVGLLIILAVVCVLRPRSLRLPYRVGMTISFYIGQIVGRILLAVFFAVALTPLALLLRLLGRDLLHLRRNSRTDTYWGRANVTNDFDRQF